MGRKEARTREEPIRPDNDPLLPATDEFTGVIEPVTEDDLIILEGLLPRVFTQMKL